MRTALIVLLVFALPALAAQTQTAWKWVDERGVTHYSDTPVPGATRIELNVSSRSRSEDAPSTPSPRPSSSSSGSTQSNAAAPTEAVYRNFEIWKPQREETIANTGGAVAVNVRVDPTLGAQHRLNLYLDGKLIEGFPRNTTNFDLKDVPRGLHSVVAIITDPAGTTIQQTAPVTFTVRQESVAQPPVGPAVKPPPKPRTSNKLPSSQPSYAALNGSDKKKKIDPNTNLPLVTVTKPDTGPR